MSVVSLLGQQSPVLQARSMGADGDTHILLVYPHKICVPKVFVPKVFVSLPYAGYLWKASFFVDRC